jgi:hypothetical protein
LRSNLVTHQEDAVNRFLAKLGLHVIGVLAGWDRLLFRGTIARLTYASGLQGFLNEFRILRQDFTAWAGRVTEEIRSAAVAMADEQGRPYVYLNSAGDNKEALVRRIAIRDKVSEGLVCVLACQESGSSFQVRGNHETKRTEMVKIRPKCQHLYWYFVDPVFGYMHVRLQTWLPFAVQVYVNGKEWLSRQMDEEGLRYSRRDNCILWTEDFARAQRLADLQLAVRWEKQLKDVVSLVSDPLRQFLRKYGLSYYWSAWQTEFATDVVMDSPKTIASIYPPLLRHSLIATPSADVMRFLAQKVHANWAGEIISSIKRRPEGVRIKHSVGHNSVKLYDKEAKAFRFETTIHAPEELKVFRRKQGDPDGPKTWRQMRLGISDLRRRAEISRNANEHFQNSVADADVSTPLGKLLQPITNPTKWKGRRVRGLRPWDAEDLRLLRAVANPAFGLNGFRNADVQKCLYGDIATDPVEKRRRVGRISRLFRMLRAHHLIEKLNSTRRYRLTEKGSQISAAALRAQELSLSQLNATA